MNLFLKALLQNKKTKTKTKDGYDKHIHYDGSREHVLSYSTNGVHCSHKNCVVNRDNKHNASEQIFIKD